MDDSHEPSYYEIALTNRQVLIFFVVLLVCVVGAFFSGIWLGQQRAGDMPTVAAVPAELEPVAEENETLAELNFFTDEETSPAGSKPASADRRSAGRPEPVASSGSPETTLLEDLNGSEREEARKREVAEAPKPAPRETTPRETTPRETSTNERTASRRASNDPSAVGGFVIQVFSSPEQAQARKVLDRLTSVGYQAFISPVDVDGRTMHRVRVGPYTDRGDAQSVATRVEKAYGLDTWVTANE